MRVKSSGMEGGMVAGQMGQPVGEGVQGAAVAFDCSGCFAGERQQGRGGIGVSRTVLKSFGTSFSGLIRPVTAAIVPELVMLCFDFITDSCYRMNVIRRVNVHFDLATEMPDVVSNVA